MGEQSSEASGARGLVHDSNYGARKVSNNALVKSLLTHLQDFFKVVVLSQLGGKKGVMKLQNRVHVESIPPHTAITIYPSTTDIKKPNI